MSDLAKSAPARRPLMHDAYVVTRPYPASGVGSNLASLAGAAWLARELGRTLLVDWRGMDLLADRSANYFTEFFACPPEIAGVPVVYAGESDTQGYHEAAAEDVVSIREVLTGGRDCARYLRLVAYHGLDRVAFQTTPIETDRFVRSVFRSIAPGPPLARAIDDYAERELAEAPFVVGVNIRTGNGHHFARGDEYYRRVDISILENEGRFLRNVKRACDRRVRGLPSFARKSYRIFFATDSIASHELLSRLPNSTTRREVFPVPGVGDHVPRFSRSGYSDREGVFDTLADMFLLARCNALVYNYSMFNQYARVSTGYFSGNLANIEQMYLRGWVPSRDHER